MLPFTSPECIRCGTRFEVQRQWPHKKFCSANCSKAHHYHTKAKHRMGTPIGSKLVCKRCGAEERKTHKRQHYCLGCSDLSTGNKLPEAIEWNRNYQREYQKRRRRESPAAAINARMSAGIKNSLGNGKNGRSWESLVGYTVADLMAHLEAKFLPGMSWDNRGEWHIDHRRPLTSFSFQTPDDPQFREAWALSNLQPLWAGDNLRKGGRWAARQEVS
jgi:hypothetical protein